MFEDWQTAPVGEPLRAALGLVRQMTLEGNVVPAEIEAARRAGVSDTGIRDALWVCSLFNMINRIADALDFGLLDDSTYERQAEALLQRGYRFPAPVAALQRFLPQRPATRALG